MSTNLIQYVDRFRALIKQMHLIEEITVDAIVLVNHEAQIQWSNTTFNQLVQQPCQNILGTNLVDILPLEQLDSTSPHIHPIEQALNQHTNGSELYQFQQSSQKLVLEISWFYLRLEHNQAIGVLAIKDVSDFYAREEHLPYHHQKHLQALFKEQTAQLLTTNQQLQKEVTIRQQAEAALWHSEERFRNLVEQMNDWVWEIDLDAIFTYTNPKVSTILGYEPGELINQAFFDFMSSGEAKRFATIFSLAIAHQEPLTNFEKSATHKNGNIVVLETNACPLFDTQGKLKGYQGVTRDITQRKQIDLTTRKALTKEKELSELRSRIITTVSHEFRTPLAIISSSTGILQVFDCKLSHTDKQEHLQVIQNSVDRIVQLLDDILFINDKQFEKMGFRPAALDLAQFCYTLLQEVQSSTDQHTIFSVIEYTAAEHCSIDAMQGYFDGRILKQILINLLSNAIKYSPYTNEIHFKLAYDGEMATFQVRDRGIGIPQAEQLHLFEPLYRASNVGTIPGMGIGLSIVKRCVNLHQGEIRVLSELDVGTIVTVAIPTQSPISEITV